MTGSGIEAEATHGRALDRRIRRLAVPALGSLVAEPVYVLVDTAVVGHLGTPELGGLAIAGTVLTTTFWLFNALAYGTTAATSRLVGAGRRAEAAASGVHALWVGVALGAVLAVAGIAATPWLLEVLGAGPAVRPHARSYLAVSWAGAPAVLVVLAATGWLRGTQDTRRPLVVAVWANVVNLVLELIAVYGLGMGVAGSAGATVIAQLGSAVALALPVVRAARAAGAPLGPDLRAARSLMVAGGPLVLRTGALLASLAVATSVAARHGAATVAAHQVAFQVWSLLALGVDALAIAGQALIGLHLGAGDLAGARAIARRLVGWGIAVGCGLALVVLAVRPVLPALFTSDPKVVALIAQVLVVVALAQPLGAVAFVLDGVLIGAGDARFLATAMLAATALYLPAAWWVLERRAGLLALWVAIGWFIALRTAAVAARVAGSRWAVAGATR